MVENEFKRKLFDLVKSRLERQSQSLIRFCNHWEGSASGVEGWFKVEFVAAIEPDVAQVRTGGSGGRGRSGKKYADFILTTPSGKEIKVETKATTSNWYIGGDIRADYDECLVAFLCRSLSRLKPSHRAQCDEIDPNSLIEPICSVGDSEAGCSLYFGLIDLTR